MPQLYEDIGRGYSQVRRTDPRLFSAVKKHLKGATSLLNVGAGTGSYEPDVPLLIAVEPALEMIRQRQSPPGHVVRACVTRLPFRDNAFDMAMAFLTLHHWHDVRQGLSEMARTASLRIVIVTWDPSFTGFWLIDQYFPEIRGINHECFPSFNDIEGVLGPIKTDVLPIPADCYDGFLGAYWQRPHAYLDPAIRRGISTFSKMKHYSAGLSRLKHDLETGKWQERNHELLSLSSMDLGYRILISDLY